MYSNDFARSVLQYLVKVRYRKAMQQNINQRSTWKLNESFSSACVILIVIVVKSKVNNIT